MQAIADAIRARTNSTQGITINEMPFQISGISRGEQATPEISVSSSGLITATAGDKSATKQLTTQSAKTITPSTSSQTAIVSGRYTTGAVTVAAIPSNYEDVTTETTAYTNELTDLVSQISALESALEGKASGSSGGASVETCTVTIHSKDMGSGSGIANDYGVTKFLNGSITTVYVTGASTGYFTEENVVCGSLIAVRVSKAINTSGVNSNDNTSGVGGASILSISSDGLIAFLQAPTESERHISFSLHND